jgi:hypothetical protein
MTNTIEVPMEREQSLLSLVCLLVAAGFFALVIYNLFAAGSIISTDGLFYTVVPLVLALPFLAVVGQEFLARRHARKSSVAADEDGRPVTGRAIASGTTPPRVIPALKDARGRAMPPDVNRMVAEMQRGEGSKQ